MKTITTAAGVVAIYDARIIRASGYGQYTIIIDMEFNGKQRTDKIHSTNSRLYDDAHDEDADQFEVLWNDANAIIEDAAHDFVSSF